MPGLGNRKREQIRALNESGRFRTESEMHQALRLAAIKLLSQEMSSVIAGELESALDVVEFYGQFDTLLKTGGVK